MEAAPPREAAGSGLSCSPLRPPGQQHPWAPPAPEAVAASFNCRLPAPYVLFSPARLPREQLYSSLTVLRRKCPLYHQLVRLCSPSGALPKDASCKCPLSREGCGLYCVGTPKMMGRGRLPLPAADSDKKAHLASQGPGAGSLRTEHRLSNACPTVCLAGESHTPRQVRSGCSGSRSGPHPQPSDPPRMQVQGGLPQAESPASQPGAGRRRQGADAHPQGRAS